MSTNTPPDYSDTSQTRDGIIQAINDLNSLLNSATTSHSVDGQSTSFDQNQARRRLQDLMNQLDRIDGKPPRKPLAYTINLNQTGGV
jgi:hypothetical protein